MAVAPFGARDSDPAGENADEGYSPDQVVRDIVVLGALVGAFAVLVTAHVTLALGLCRRTPRWRAPVAFVVVPLAPAWGWRTGMRARSAIWVAAAVVYAVAAVVDAH